MGLKSLKQLDVQQTETQVILVVDTHFFSFGTNVSCSELCHDTEAGPNWTQFGLENFQRIIRQFRFEDF